MNVAFRSLSLLNMPFQMKKVCLFFPLLLFFSCKKDNLSWTLLIKNKSNETLYIQERTYLGAYNQTLIIGANDSAYQKSMIAKLPYSFLAINIDGDTIDSFAIKSKKNKEHIWQIEP